MDVITWCVLLVAASSAGVASDPGTLMAPAGEPNTMVCYSLLSYILKITGVC